MRLVVRCEHQVGWVWTLPSGTEIANKSSRCKAEGIRKAPYARLCNKHYEESKASFRSLSEEEKDEIRDEGRTMGVSCDW